MGNLEMSDLEKLSNELLSRVCCLLPDTAMWILSMTSKKMRKITNREFFVRVGKQILAAVDGDDEDGYGQEFVVHTRRVRWGLKKSYFRQSDNLVLFLANLHFDRDIVCPLEVAARGGRFDALKQMIETCGYTWDFDLLPMAAEAGCLEIIEWLVEKATAGSNALQNYSVISAVDRGLQEVSVEIMSKAVDRGNIRIIAWGMKQMRWFPEDIAKRAADNCQYDVVRWLSKEKRYRICVSLLHKFAFQGDVEMLKEFSNYYTIDADFNDYSYYYNLNKHAINGGSVDVVRWLRLKRKCWSDELIELAMEKKCFDILKFILVDCGVPCPNFQSVRFMPLLTGDLRDWLEVNGLL